LFQLNNAVGFLLLAMVLQIWLSYIFVVSAPLVSQRHRWCGGGAPLFKNCLEIMFVTSELAISTSSVGKED
jgi:hypothetical protein